LNEVDEIDVGSFAEMRIFSRGFEGIQRDQNEGWMKGGMIAIYILLDHLVLIHTPKSTS
jgi:hypothetical protein